MYFFSFLLNKTLFKNRVPDDTLISSIMVIKLDNVGDIVLSSLLMSAVAERFGNAKIVYVVKKGLKDLLFPLDSVSEVVEVPYGKGHCSQMRDNEKTDERAARSIIKKYLKEQRPQMIVDLRTSSLGNFAAVMARVCAGTRFRVTIDLFRIKEIFGIRADRRAKWDRHEVETFYFAMRDAGIFPRGPDYRSGLRFWDLSKKLSQDICPAGFSTDRPFILVQPGAVWEFKRWPSAYYSKLISSIAGHYWDASFVLVGTADERETSMKVFDRLDEKTRERTTVLTGKTSLKELVALVNLAELVIANDSGVAHIAGALGIRTIVFFGPSSPERFEPLSIHEGNIKVFHRRMECCPCDQMNCRYDRDSYCLSRISPGLVEEYVENVLA